MKRALQSNGKRSSTFTNDSSNNGYHFRLNPRKKKERLEETEATRAFSESSGYRTNGNTQAHLHLQTFQSASESGSESSTERSGSSSNGRIETEKSREESTNKTNEMRERVRSNETEGGLNCVCKLVRENINLARLGYCLSTYIAILNGYLSQILLDKEIQKRIRQGVLKSHGIPLESNTFLRFALLTPPSLVADPNQKVSSSDLGSNPLFCCSPTVTFSNAGAAMVEEGLMSENYTVGSRTESQVWELYQKEVSRKELFIFASSRCRCGDKGHSPRITLVLQLYGIAAAACTIVPHQIQFPATRKDKYRLLALEVVSFAINRYVESDHIGQLLTSALRHISHRLAKDMNMEVCLLRQEYGSKTDKPWWSPKSGFEKDLAHSLMKEEKQKKKLRTWNATRYRSCIRFSKSHLHMFYDYGKNVRDTLLLVTTLDSINKIQSMEVNVNGLISDFTRFGFLKFLLKSFNGVMIHIPSQEVPTSIVVRRRKMSNHLAACRRRIGVKADVMALEKTATIQEDRENKKHSIVSDGLTATSVRKKKLFPSQTEKISDQTVLINENKKSQTKTRKDSISSETNKQYLMKSQSMPKDDNCKSLMTASRFSKESLDMTPKEAAKIRESIADSIKKALKTPFPWQHEQKQKSLGFSSRTNIQKVMQQWDVDLNASLNSEMLNDYEREKLAYSRTAICNFHSKQNLRKEVLTCKLGPKRDVAKEASGREKDCKD
eukprot:CAMPEP_0184006034 /NCGR_PEP_ID=MMETSP0954-20121128/424_1 /TAXON_ID=627963 /ORGANISM="Aplanochytrium sp, Strain PBS07" /LENGTH=721 /DNA_ID=CAMNT_0026284449 /DNA_START=66 /DNA_END=2231 /DNA_ORIENTATION=-